MLYKGWLGWECVAAGAARGHVAKDALCVLRSCRTSTQHFAQSEMSVVMGTCFKSAFLQSVDLSLRSEGRLGGGPPFVCAFVPTWSAFDTQQTLFGATSFSRHARACAGRVEA